MLTKGGNTNNNAATDGPSLHTRRHWFAAKNPSWRSRTRSWTLRGTPPKEAAGRRVKHRKKQIGALWSRRAKALTEWHWSSRQCSAPTNRPEWGVSRRQRSNNAFASLRSRVEAFSEPAVDRRKQFARLLHLALVAPKPRHADCGAEFSRFCLLLLCNRQCSLEISLGFRCVWLPRQQSDLASQTISLRLEPPFLSGFDCSHCFVHAAFSVIELAELRVGTG